jgi:hypothetical protein
VKKKKMPQYHGKLCVKQKKNGGLGVLDLDLMTKSLLAKWIIRFKDPTVQKFWKDILMFKYLNSHNRQVHSSFWKYITVDQEVIGFCFNKTIGNGKSIKFWLDSETTLSYEFSNLFILAIDPQISVEQALQLEVCLYSSGITRTRARI